MPGRRDVITALLGACAAAALASSTPSIEVWVELRTDVPGTDLDALARDLKDLGAEEIARVRQPAPALAIRVDPARLDTIRQWPSVRRIRPLRTLHPPTPGSAAGTR